MDKFNDYIEQLKNCIQDFNEIKLETKGDIYTTYMQSNSINPQIAIENNTESINEVDLSSDIVIYTNGIPMYIDSYSTIFIMNNEIVFVQIENSYTIIDLKKESSFNIKVVLNSFEKEHILIELNL